MRLEINNLKKSYGEGDAIKKITVVVEECKALALIGPSGSGKSSLLRLLAGLDRCDRGEIVIDGSVIPKDERRLLEHRKKMGYVFQSFNLFPHLTLLENIVLPLYLVHKYSKQDAHERAIELLRQFELSKHMEKKPSQLSGGQSQRGAIVRAISVKRDLLLFDEPTSALDPYMTGEVLDLISALKDCTLVIASHHIAFLEKISDWVLFLKEGRMVESTSKEEFFDRPQTSEAREFLRHV